MLPTRTTLPQVKQKKLPRELLKLQTKNFHHLKRSTKPPSGISTEPTTEKSMRTSEPSMTKSKNNMMPSSRRGIPLKRLSIDSRMIFQVSEKLTSKLLKKDSTQLNSFKMKVTTRLSHMIQNLKDHQLSQKRTMDLVEMEKNKPIHTL